jgi:hypothetical protein
MQKNKWHATDFAWKYSKIIFNYFSLNIYRDIWTLVHTLTNAIHNFNPPLFYHNLIAQLNYVVCHKIDFDYSLYTHSVSPYHATHCTPTIYYYYYWAKYKMHGKIAETATIMSNVFHYKLVLKECLCWIDTLFGDQTNVRDAHTHDKHD